MTRAFKNRLKSTAKTVGKAALNGAIWLWKLPPVANGARTVLVRIGLGSTAVAIVSAIFDAAAK